ncbi:MAG: DEAD/DEAH box helicase [Oscillospiraceae bacterium]|nr:DEAD/DEAH box helicase [Oscillospiraceae bacterium]
MNRFVENVMNEYTNEKTLFVLAGYEVPEYNLSDTVKNGFTRVLKLCSTNKPVISYDEYLLIKAMLYEAFDKIVIIKNSLYHNLFPVMVNIDDKIKKSLENHFNPDAGPKTSIEGIEKYLDVYKHFTLTSGNNLACVYNDDDVSQNGKVEIKIESVSALDTEEINELKDSTVCRIATEKDYLDFVLKCENSEDIEICSIETENHDKTAVRNYIGILNGKFNGRIRIYKNLNSRERLKNANPEIVETMKKYWNFDTFRSFRTYDVDVLERGEKKIVNISQEEIINTIVLQAEKASKNEVAGDIFVTAPTGAGKSLLFQLPAIYLAEKYGLVTLVVSPLIGLMNDQVKSLNRKGYTKARTINSDLSPVVKQEILDDVAEGKCDILYLSPESLLGKSDIEQIIGKRKIGMVVIDESHIVTTWGKQFRPDYWFLGEHISRIRKAQRNSEIPSSFVIATFTATAIYRGKEDMHGDTISSLNMVNPITYLGYVKRDNISIDIDNIETKRNKTEYEKDKFNSIIDILRTAIMRNQKTLIYFPTVALIERFDSYCSTTSVGDYVVKYHGRMDGSDKNESFELFKDGVKPVMIATKAFGMGIDIPDIVNVIHFAPTGNVCDYIQEIGRAGRDTSIEAHAIYKHMANDFMHINRLHGLSAIKKYQLIEVMRKILDVYNSKLSGKNNFFVKKNNGMMIDAENFAYIFKRAGLESDDTDLIKKVKTAMLLIQKDAERKNYSPFHMRPETIFRYGYFNISESDIKKLNKEYCNVSKLVSEEKDIYKVNLEEIWKKSYSHKMSFPKFKYLLYTGSDELEVNKDYELKSAIEVDFQVKNNGEENYVSIIDALKSITGDSIISGKYINVRSMIGQLAEKTGLSKYVSENIINVFIASIDTYTKKFSKSISGKCYNPRPQQSGEISYCFLSGIEAFFRWVRVNKNKIFSHSEEEKFYVVNEKYNKSAEVLTVLGLLESFGVLTFSSTGGSDSQIYIYVNETKSMEIAVKRPDTYKNKLLENIKERHEVSVKMMTYLYQNNLTSDEIWEHLENYLLGKLPDAIKDENCEDFN